MIVGEGATGPPVALRVVPLRHPLRSVATALILGVLALFAWSIATNENIHWNVVGQYLFSPLVLDGVVTTIQLTIVAMAVGIGLGVVLAVMRVGPVPVLAAAAWLFVWVFRGVPTLVQLIFWYNLATFYPVIGLTLPGGLVLFSVSANTLINPLTAAVLGLGLSEAAYMAEIVRAGIVSVDPGQSMAAQSLGMTRIKTMRRIVLPQALRVIVPPTGNNFIGMLKFTSLASVISLQELTQSVSLIYNLNFEIIPLLVVASLWYLILTSGLTLIQLNIERSLSGQAVRLDFRDWMRQTVRRGLGRHVG